MPDPISIIARRLTGLVAWNCCHRTGGQGGHEPCECREQAALILSDIKGDHAMTDHAEALAEALRPKMADLLRAIANGWDFETSAQSLATAENNGWVVGRTTLTLKGGKLTRTDTVRLTDHGRATLAAYDAAKQKETTP